MAAAFATYSCMYAFRKPFTAAEFAGESFAGLDYKGLLVASQLLGYTASKFLGIRVVSAALPHRRGWAILGLIGVAQLAWLGFALTPSPWGWPWLLLNGLPLGMVFGLVLSYLEGRRDTEALAAGLCASFILASGVVKSVGRWLIIDVGVPEVTMPLATGAIFALPLVVSVWLLNQIPPPRPEDIAERAVRPPMDRADRRRLLDRHALGVTLIVSIYVVLTVLRSLRDDFAVEIWQGLGIVSDPSVFARSETMVTVAVLIFCGLGSLVRDNRRAFLLSLGSAAVGCAVVVLAVECHAAGWLEAFGLMVTVGFGCYLPYITIHTTVFERLIAVFRERGNLVFLLYVADSVGYLGYAALIPLRSRIAPHAGVVEWFLDAAWWVGLSGTMLGIVLLAYYWQRLSARKP